MTGGSVNHPASYFDKRPGDAVQCRLCPRQCIIAKGGSGACLARTNIDGTLFATTYGEITSAHVDPIEKKPLYHFAPGSRILSIGSHGCNLRCPFCQNWQISTRRTQTTHVTAQDLVQAAQDSGSIGIAYTYNEPLIWFEFIRDTAPVFRKAGLKNVLVSNGQIMPDPLTELLPHIDAANIDLKGFSQSFYDWVGGSLEAAIRTIKMMAQKGVHVEVTNLVIPGRNDDIRTFTDMCRTVASISKHIPLHLSKYFPAHKSVEPPTPEKTLTTLYAVAKEHLHHVYIGNIAIPGMSDTRCHSCGELCIQRSGYNTHSLLKQGDCPTCGTHQYGYWP